MYWLSGRLQTRTMQCDASGRWRRSATADYVRGRHPTAATRSPCHEGDAASGASKRLASKAATARGCMTPAGRHIVSPAAAPEHLVARDTEGRCMARRAVRVHTRRGEERGPRRRRLRRRRCPSRLVQRTPSLQATHSGYRHQGFAVASHHRDREQCGARSAHPVPQGNTAAPAVFGALNGVIRSPLNSSLLCAWRAQERAAQPETRDDARSQRAQVARQRQRRAMPSKAPPPQGPRAVPDRPARQSGAAPGDAPATPSAAGGGASRPQTAPPSDGCAVDLKDQAVNLSGGVELLQPPLGYPRRRGGAPRRRGGGHRR